MIGLAAVLCFLPLSADSESDADTGSALIGSTEYATVYDALKASVSGDVIFAVPDSDAQVNLTQDAVIKKGVTLVLPYSAANDPTGTTDGDDKATSKVAGNSMRYLAFTVASGVTLTVEGDLIVGGTLSKRFTFDYQGHISGDFSRMMIYGTVDVKDGGRVYCYGSVMGGGYLKLQDGAELYEPMMITDFVGGDLTYVSYQNGQSPFNRYAFQNLQSKFTMTSGATVYGLLNLYANSNYNKVTEPIVSNTEGLIILSDGATLTSSYKYAEYLESEWESNIYKDVGKKYIKIAGGASFGSLIIDVQGQHANTASTIFSVPYNFDITLQDGAYEISNGIRFLPGSSLTVAKSANLTVTGTLLAYNGLYDKEFRDKYYPTTEILGSYSYSKIAKLVVNGVLDIEGTFAGLVQSTVAGGLVHIDSGAKVSLTAQQYGAKGSFQGKAVDNLSKMDLRAFAMDGYGNQFDLVAGKTYTSSDKADHVLSSYSCYSPVDGKLTTVALDQTVTGSWYAGTLKVTYSANGGTGTAPTDPKRYESGEYASVLGQNGLSKDGYIFAGWATDSKGTGTIYTQGQAVQVNSDIKFYAVWKASTPVTGITLDKTSATIDVGGSVTLKATITPSDAVNKTVSWSTSNSKVATVSNGKVTGISAGTAKITATTADGGYKAVCTVTVNGAVSVTGITLDKTTATVDAGSSITLEATVKPSNATDKTIIWSTSSSKVATVSNGKVTGVAAGEVTITATTSDGGYTAKCTVTVTAPVVEVKGVSLDQDSVTVKEGKTATLRATVLPTSATDKTVTWSVADSSVATVSNGVVYGKSVGTTVVTVRTADGGYEATCEVTVTSALVKVTGVNIMYEKETLATGGSILLSYEVLPSDATETGVTWSSSDSSVATVANGLVKAKAPGTAVITVKTEDGGFTDTCTVTVQDSVIEATGVSLSKDSISMEKGTDAVLVATVQPSNATSKAVVWYSDDDSIVSVDIDGAIHAKAPGTTTIRVTTADGKHYDTCTVTVEQESVPVTSVALDRNVLSLSIGATDMLNAIVSPNNATWDSMVWSSSDTSVATVSDGRVTGVSEGTATIAVSVGEFQDICVVTVTKAGIAVTEVSLNVTEKTLNVGESFVLQADVKPSDATDKSVSWTTTDAKIASVSDGTVTALSPGVARITVITTDGNLSATCVVTVTDDVIEVTGVTLDKNSATFAIGESIVLQAEVAPSNATDKSVFWTTSDSEVATVEDGVVTGVSAGSVVITVTTIDGSYSAQCGIEVLPAVIHVTKVSLDRSTMSMSIGDSAQLVASVLPSDAFNRNVVWSSSDSKVATVSGGLVKAITNGTATITVTTEDGSYSASCVVTVDTPSSEGDNTLLYIAVGVLAVLMVLLVIYVIRSRSP